MSVVDTVQDATGTVATYSYDSSGRMTRVQYADTSTGFNYTDAGYISSVVDAAGKVLEAHTYDASGRGTSSQKADGVEAVTISYPSPGVAQVTNWKGEVSTYTFTQIGGRSYMTSSKGPGSVSCGYRGDNTFTYDSVGNLLSVKDALGHVTSYTYDAMGNVTSVSKGGTQ
jgi:YD repeat-containing protein